MYKLLSRLLYNIVYLSPELDDMCSVCNQWESCFYGYIMICNDIVDVSLSTRG